MSAPDTIVVGSGISGLSAAVVLAMHGRRPLVLEAHNTPGGCMQMFQRRGARFDTGVHYVGSLYPGQIMWRLFRYMGIDVPTQPLDRECFDRISLPDGEFCVPVGWDKLAAALKLACPDEAPAIEAYVAKMRRVEASLNWHSLDVHAEGAYERDLYETSLGAYLRALGVSPRLRSLMCAQSSLYAVRADDVPLAIHAAVIGSAVEGPHYVVGGGDAITRPLVDRLRKLGGDLRVRAPVHRVLVHENAAAGVELAGGETIHAPEVILAIHPHAAIKLMPADAWRGVLRERLAAAPESIGAFVVYGIVDADMTGRNHYLLRESDPDCFYNPQLDGPANAIVNFPPPSDGRRLFSAMSSARAEWFAPWHDSRTLRRDADYRTLKDKLTGNVMSMINQRLPELSGKLHLVDASTPLTMRDYVGYPGGGIYGLAPGLAAQGRFGVRRRTRYAGLYVSGAGTGTPGILGACVTGFGVCGSILGTDELIQQIRAATDEPA